MSFLLLFLILLDVNVFVNATETAPDTGATAGTPLEPDTAANVVVPDAAEAVVPDAPKTTGRKDPPRKMGSGVHQQDGENCWAYAFAAMLRGLGIAGADPKKGKGLATGLCEKYPSYNPATNAMMKDFKPNYLNIAYPLSWPADFKGELHVITNGDYEINADIGKGNSIVTGGYPRKENGMNVKTRDEGVYFSIADVKKFLPSVFSVWQKEDRSRLSSNIPLIWSRNHFMPTYKSFKILDTAKDAAHAMTLVDILAIEDRKFLILKNSHDVTSCFLGYICLEVESGTGSDAADKFKLPNLPIIELFRFTTADETVRQERFGPLSHPFERMTLPLIDFFQSQTIGDRSSIRNQLTELKEHCEEAEWGKVKDWMFFYDDSEAKKVRGDWELMFETEYLACEFCETAFSWYRLPTKEWKQFICWKYMNNPNGSVLKKGIRVACTRTDGRKTDKPVKGTVTELLYRDTITVTGEDDQTGEDIEYEFKRTECEPDTAPVAKPEAKPEAKPLEEGKTVETKSEGSAPAAPINEGNSVDIAVSGDNSQNEIKRVASMKSMKEFQDMHTGFIVASIISVCILVGYFWHGRKVEEPTLTSPLITV